jgi:hypothetical protein
LTEIIVIRNTGQVGALNARVSNGNAHYSTDTIYPVFNAAQAPVPASYPATRGGINAMTYAQLTACLNYYGAPANGTRIVKRRRFCSLIGAPVISIN